MADSALHAAAGAVGGCVAMAITYPLVNLSTRAQVTAKHSARLSTRAAALDVIRRDGLRALYDGLGSSLVGISVTNAVYYAAFEQCRATLLKRRKGSAGAALSTLESITASFVAGCATSIISNPIWVINTRQTVQTTLADEEGQEEQGGVRVTKKLNVLQTIKHILKTDGWTGFFHGLAPALVLVINPILQFSLFEQLKARLLKIKPKLSDIDFFILGAISKLFATGISYPYLTIKSRQQAGTAGEGGASAHKTLALVLKQHGLAGLYRGVAPKLAQSVATAAILFVAKERVYQVTKEAVEKAQRTVKV